jgi:predicted secreted hydrolase
MRRVSTAILARALFGTAGLLALAACGDARPPVADAARAVATGTRFLAGPESEGFARATGPREFRFPEDHGAHSDFRTEWWYFTGNLRDASSKRYGFELTFFRIGLAAGDAQRASAWGTRQMWMAHFAVTDAAGRRFFAAQRLARDALGFAGAQGAPFRVWVKDWEVGGSAGRDRTQLRLTARDGNVAVDLHLDGSQPPVLQGEGGLDSKGPEPGNASYYYSMPRLAVSGTLRLEGEDVDVEGRAWMDREWSTSALSDGTTGWDWFALRLEDGRDLMFYRLRRSDGARSEFSGGTLVEASGMIRRLRADDVELTELGSWTSPVTAVRYPVRWRLRVPGAGLDLEVEPYIPNQELVLSVRYWEGAVRAVSREGGGGGDGYLELAGY